MSGSMHGSVVYVGMVELRTYIILPVLCFHFHLVTVGKCVYNKCSPSCICTECENCVTTVKQIGGIVIGKITG